MLPEEINDISAQNAHRRVRRTPSPPFVKHGSAMPDIITSRANSCSGRMDSPQARGPAMTGSTMPSEVARDVYDIGPRLIAFE